MTQGFHSFFYRRQDSGGHAISINEFHLAVIFLGAVFRR
jgi:hypothetical protein